ncbi:MAG: hypothetical protein KJ799_11790 [Bacteroidetes bacterium]|nr:hypothetical protein [Bacteroidota bacterium]
MKIEYVQEEIEQHIKRIEAILPEIEEWLPLKSSSFESTEVEKTIDSFIFKFIKLQDKIGEKLFPAALQILQEYKPNMPFIDTLNVLERLELINSADEWIDFRKLRNTLTHEYPDNQDEIIDAVNLAVEVLQR